jgi:hypothetical protein
MESLITGAMHIRAASPGQWPLTPQADGFWGIAGVFIIPISLQCWRRDDVVF